MLEDVVNQARTMITTFVNQSKAQLISEITSYEDKIKSQINFAENKIYDEIKKLAITVEELKINSTEVSKSFSKLEIEAKQTLMEVQQTLISNLENFEKKIETNQQLLEKISATTLKFDVEFINLIKKYEEEIGNVVIKTLFKKLLFLKRKKV